MVLTETYEKVVHLPYGSGGGGEESLGCWVVGAQQQPDCPHCWKRRGNWEAVWHTVGT